MRSLIVTEFVSLDGVMEAPGGEAGYAHTGWTFKDVPFEEAAYELKATEQDEAGAMLIGRVSYEAFAPIWPTLDDFPRYNEMPKYVVSTTLDEAEVENGPWANCHVVRSLDDVRALKEGDGDPLIVHGSATLARSLTAAGLVDRYHLLVFPLILGSGKKIWGDSPKHRLALTDHAAYANGIQKMVYDVVR